MCFVCCNRLCAAVIVPSAICFSARDINARVEHAMNTITGALHHFKNGQVARWCSDLIEGLHTPPTPTNEEQKFACMVVMVGGVTETSKKAFSSLPHCLYLKLWERPWRRQRGSLLLVWLYKLCSNGFWARKTIELMVEVFPPRPLSSITFQAKIQYIYYRSICSYSAGRFCEKKAVIYHHLGCGVGNRSHPDVLSDGQQPEPLSAARWCQPAGSHACVFVSCFQIWRFPLNPNVAVSVMD